MSIVVRNATVRDAAVIAAFNQSMALETEGKVLDARSVRQGVLTGLSDPARSRYFLAVIDDTVSGQIMVTTEWSDWRNGFFWWIQSVYVDKRYRRKGVFRAMYDHVRTLARSEPGVCGLRLYVHSSNDRAIATYQQLGMDLTEYKLCEEGWR